MYDETKWVEFGTMRPSYLKEEIVNSEDLKSKRYLIPDEDNGLVKFNMENLENLSDDSILFLDDDTAVKVVSFYEPANKQDLVNTAVRVFPELLSNQSVYEGDTLYCFTKNEYKKYSLQEDEVYKRADELRCSNTYAFLDDDDKWQIDGGILY